MPVLERYKDFWVYPWMPWNKEVVDNLCTHNEYRLDLLNIGPREEVLIDLGANIGVFSWLYHQRNPLARILCVEADPRLFEALLANVSAFASVVCVACAAAPRRFVRFAQHPIRGAMGPTSYANNALSINIDHDFYWPTFSLEEIVLTAGLGQPDVIKMDIEAYEFQVLENTTVLPKRYLIGEWHEDEARWLKILANRFKGWDYRCGWGPVPPVFHLIAPGES